MAMRTRGAILVVDDEEAIRKALGRCLRARGFDLVEAASASEAERAAADGALDVAIVVQVLPDGTGIELLPRLRRLQPGLLVIMLTGHATIDMAVQAVKEGAEQFLTKPVDIDALVLLLERSIDARRGRQNELAARARGRVAPDPFLGASGAVRRLRDEAHEVLESDRPVLLLGETGSGKGVLARWLHESGPRGKEPFVDVNCAGISRELLDAELFGHEAGAFTGALKAKSGLFEVAHRGSVFLDEVGDMDPGIQARLLKVLEEKRFRRLGDVRDRFVDIRLIAATHQDLGRLMTEGRFRADLYYRISALELRLPSLRERLEDVAALASWVLAAFARETGCGATELSPAALALLTAYHWPGNVRELRNVLETAAIRGRGGVLRPEDLRLRSPQDPSPGAIPTLAHVEGEHIRRTLEAMDGHVARTAAALGVSTSALYERLKRLGLAADQRRSKKPAPRAG